MSDSVNHPEHYGGEDNPYEAIKILEACLSPEEFRGFCRGNALKYLLRAEKKNGIEDYRKAEWYSKKLSQPDDRSEARKPVPFEGLAEAVDYSLNSIRLCAKCGNAPAIAERIDTGVFCIWCAYCGQTTGFFPTQYRAGLAWNAEQIRLQDMEKDDAEESLQS